MSTNRPPLRVGLLTPALSGYNAVDSGIGQHFADLAQGLRDLGHSVVAITPEPRPTSAPAPTLHGIKFVPFNPRMPRWLDRLTGVRWQLHSAAGLRQRGIAADAALATAVQQEGIDVVETTSSGALALCYLRRRSRAPVVTRVSTTAAQLVSHNAGRVQWPYRLEQKWEEQLVRRSDRLVTHTTHHRDALCQLWDLPATSFTIIPHGITLPPREALRPLSSTTIDVLYVGRFEHRKGIDVWLDVIPSLVAAEPTARFILVGQDPDDYWQKKFWSDHPTLDRRRVIFAGAASAQKLQEWYQACSFLVAPSRYESFGLIYVEAMAWGKPVIGCRAGGVPEVIADGQTGLLAEPGDAASLRTVVQRLLQGPALREKMGAAARLSAEANFSRELLAARSVDFYRTVVAAAR